MTSSFSRRTRNLSDFLLAFSLMAFFIVCALTQSPAQSAAHAPAPPANAVAWFTDEAAKAGLTMRNVFGGIDTKKYIIETTGTGVAIFDYDNDGWPDIFVVNGTTLDPVPGGAQPTSHLYHNNHDGTFADVTEKAGLWPT